jgi:hypothetical protein
VSPLAGHPTSSGLKPVKNAKKRYTPIFRKHMKIKGNYSFSAATLIGTTVANEANRNPGTQRAGQEQGEENGTVKKKTSNPRQRIGRSSGR